MNATPVVDSGTANGRGKPADFSKVWDEERKLLACERGGSATADDVKKTACGLAFSGGGIRSATFNLGVIQALSEKKLLQRFDYLSTVSGGGYIGSWLSTLLYRRAGGDAAELEKLIAPPPPATAGAPAQSEPAQVSGAGAIKEDRSIRWLRTYSNYLTPRLGFFSGDSQAAISTWLRNFFLNIAVFTTLLTTLLLLPRLLQQWGTLLTSEPWSFIRNYETRWLWALAIPAVLIVALNLVREASGDPTDKKPLYTRNWVLIAVIVLPLTAAAWMGAEYLALIAYNDYTRFTEYGNVRVWIKHCAIAYAAMWLVSLLVIVPRRCSALHRYSTRLRTARNAAVRHAARPAWDLVIWSGKFVVCTVLAGMLAGPLFKWAAELLGGFSDKEAPWVVFVFGTPLFLVVVLTVVTIHIGLMARNFSDQHHEFWSRIGGMLQNAIVLWLIVTGLAAFAAPVIDWLAAWAVGGGAVWLITSLAGVWLGKSTVTGSAGTKGWREAVTKIAPYVFVVGFLGLLSWGIQQGFVRHGLQPQATAGEACEPYRPVTESGQEPGIYLHAPQDAGGPVTTRRVISAPTMLQVLHGHIRFQSCLMQSVSREALAYAFVIFTVLTLLLGWRINVNLYSIHKFYRNRLTRCYLGATRANRHPSPVTGFDPDDDVAMSMLAQRPYPIINTAINLNAGRELAWQQRKAASFVFTPLYTGYEPASAMFRGGYRKTCEYAMAISGDSLKLGTAVATSGAAASPNWGFHTDPAVAFLLTLFNVRLGRWCGDTANSTAWKKEDPTFSLLYWVSELAGRADIDLPFVYLSDGGHFENLGIYELVRRRCPLIVACDAGADPAYVFDDLGEAIRKCYIDFGVEIEIDVKSIVPGKKSGCSELHYAIGRIHYERAKDPSPVGQLIYIKASVTKDLPADLRHYKSEYPDFPHQTTADQFFDEAQFESYRKLGYETAIHSVAHMAEKGILPPALT